MGTPWLVTEPSSMCYALYSFQSPSTVIRPQRLPEQHVHQVQSNLTCWLPVRVYRARDSQRREPLSPCPHLTPSVPLSPRPQRYEFCALEQPLGKSVYLQGEKRRSKGDFDLTKELVRAPLNGHLYLRLFIIIWLLKNKVIFRKHFQNHPLCKTLEYLFHRGMVSQEDTVNYWWWLDPLQWATL